jgi:hypothetical protein
VIAPWSIRQTPITNSPTVARAGRASRVASKLAVTRAASIRASRSSSALAAKRRPSDCSAWSALTTRAPSKLSWATADMSPSRSWPRVVGSSTRRWKIRFRTRMAETTSRPRAARNGSARNIQTAAAASMVSTPVANGRGERISEAASRSPSAPGQQLPRRVPVVPGQRQPVVPLDQPLAQSGLDACGDHGGGDPAADDAGGLDQAHGHDGAGGGQGYPASNWPVSNRGSPPGRPPARAPRTAPPCPGRRPSPPPRRS